MLSILIALLVVALASVGGWLAFGAFEERRTRARESIARVDRRVARHMLIARMTAPRRPPFVAVAQSWRGEALGWS